MGGLVYNFSLLPINSKEITMSRQHACWLIASLWLLAASAYANEKAEPDPAQSPYWGSVKQLMFGGGHAR